MMGKVFPLAATAADLSGACARSTRGNIPFMKTTPAVSRAAFPVLVRARLARDADEETPLDGPATWGPGP